MRFICESVRYRRVEIGVGKLDGEVCGRFKADVVGYRHAGAAGEIADFPARDVIGVEVEVEILPRADSGNEYTPGVASPARHRGHIGAVVQDSVIRGRGVKEVAIDHLRRV